jgi:hypothetical protein
MTPQQMVGLAVRLFALWLAYSAFGMLVSGIAADAIPGVKSTSGFFVTTGIMFLLAAFLWFLPMTVAHRLIPRTRFADTLAVPAAHQVAVVACVILGLWLFFARALPGLAYQLSLLILVRAYDMNQSGEFTRLIPGAIECAAAAVLCFRAHAIARFFLTERPPVDEAADEE